VPLLVRLGRKTDALKLLEQAIDLHANESELLIFKAVVLALMDRSPAAEQTLRSVELRWPEWERAYLVHGLISERSGRPKDAREKLRTAAALGSRHPALSCALGRLAGNSTVGPECTCSSGLEQLLFLNCAR
jgi:Flp pilus assembly protein TadD